MKNSLNEQTNTINNTNKEINYNELNKEKFYCYKCIKENKITELKIDSNDKNSLLIPNCGHYGSNFYKLCFCNIDNCWTTSRGLGTNTHKNCCIHRENKDIFAKANKKSIEAKRKNGTLLNGIKSMQKSYIGSEKHLENCKRAITDYNNRPEIKEMHAKARIKYNQSKEGRENSRKLILKSIKNGKLIPYAHLEFCNICNKETIHWSHKCSICNPNAGGACSKEYRIFESKIECNINCNYIDSCIYKEKRFKNKWGWCKEYVFSQGGLEFNREKFYKEKLNIISFNSLDKEVKFQDFNSLKGKLGVWSRWTDKNYGNYCLDVCKTKDIGSEMLSSLRSFNSLVKNPNQELDIGWKKKYYNQAKDAGLFDKDSSGKIIFKLVALCDNEKEALMIEQQYAHNNKAKYWSPEPGQLNLLEE